MTSLHFEGALNFLIDELTKVPAAGVGQAIARQNRAHGSDIWIDDVSLKYWRLHGQAIKDIGQDAKEPPASSSLPIPCHPQCSHRQRTSRQFPKSSTPFTTEAPSRRRSGRGGSGGCPRCARRIALRNALSHSPMR